MFFTVFQQANTPLCILCADPPDYTLIAFNQEFEKVTARNLSGASGHSIFEVFQPSDEASVAQFGLLKKNLNDVFQSRSHLIVPLLHFQSPAGTSEEPERSSWQITITPITDSSGIAFLLCTLLNVTENERMRRAAEAARAEEIRLLKEVKQAHRRLTESEQRLREMNEQLEMKVISRTGQITASEQRFKLILNALPQITWTMTCAGKAEFYNKRWYDYTGLPASESGVSDWQHVVHPDDLQPMLSSLTTILAGNQPGELETRLRAKDDTYHWFLVRLQPLSSDNNADLWAVIAAGIDSLKKLQQEKDDFISIASHELKSPLTTLKASIQLIDRIKDSGDTEKFNHLIRQANKSMHKVSTLVDDLLNVRRINEAQLPINQKNVKVIELINGCCNHISITTPHNLIVTGDKNLEVFADEAAIDRVIVNLVNNAVKYAPNSKDIEVHVKRLGRMAKISVADRGPGIPSDKLHRIFERYYQAQKSSFNNPGLGLGLFISAEIVRRHGGRIGVESEEGKGSTFWFCLPLANTRKEN